MSYNLGKMTYAQFVAGDLHPDNKPLNETMTPLNYTQEYMPELNITDMTSAWKHWHRDHESTMVLLQGFASTNVVLNIIQIFIMLNMMKLQGLKQFFKRAYSWIDICFYTINILISIEIFNMFESEGTELIRHQRILETFGIILFLLKSFYYMKLADKIAPLVSIIFRIC